MPTVIKIKNNNFGFIKGVWQKKGGRAIFVTFRGGVNPNNLSFFLILNLYVWAHFKLNSKWIHIHIYTYIHTYMHTYIHAYMHTYIHTYISKDDKSSPITCEKPKGCQRAGLQVNCTLSLSNMATINGINQ